MIPTIGHFGKDKTMEIVKISVVASGWGEGEMNRSTEDFEGSETILYDTTMVHVYHHTFVQIPKMYNTKTES